MCQQTHRSSSSSSSSFEVPTKKMKWNNGYLVVIFLQIVMSWVCVTRSSRPFAPHDHDSSSTSSHVHQLPGAGAGAGSDQSSHYTLKIKLSKKEVNYMTSSSNMSNEEAATSSLMKGEVEGLAVVVRRIGSSPPNCEHKCYGCIPCEPTQVPTTHVGIQYANYEPEGWKCKCGPSFYTP